MTTRIALIALLVVCAKGLLIANGAAMQQTGGAQVAQVNQTVLATLPAPVRSLVQSAAVPVLVPVETPILRRGQLITGDGYYSFSSQVDGLSLVLQGSPITPATPAVATKPPAAVQAGARSIFTSLNEGIRTATWIENRVAYSLDLECAKADDQRCTQTQYLMQIIEKLAFVGGGRR